MVTTPQSTQSYRWGFAYGPRVSGSSSPTSYLWSQVNGGGAPCPSRRCTCDRRSPRRASRRSPTAARRPSASAGGQVACARVPVGRGRHRRQQPTEGYVEVQAFTQSGNTIFVGGNFASVQRDLSGTGAVAQPFLAAFDVTTGELVSSFRPALNEQVHALDDTAGRLDRRRWPVHPGQRSPCQQTRDPGPHVGRDPPGMSGPCRNRGTSAPPPLVQTLDVQDGWLYVGGAFTHLSGPNARTVAGREPRPGRGDRWRRGSNWNRRLNGTVNDVDVLGRITGLRGRLLRHVRWAPGASEPPPSLRLRERHGRRSSRRPGARTRTTSGPCSRSRTRSTSAAPSTPSSASALRPCPGSAAAS